MHAALTMPFCTQVQVAISFGDRKALSKQHLFSDGGVHVRAMISPLNAEKILAACRLFGVKCIPVTHDTSFILDYIFLRWNLSVIVLYLFFVVSKTA